MEIITKYTGSSTGSLVLEVVEVGVEVVSPYSTSVQQHTTTN